MICPWLSSSVKSREDPPSPLPALLSAIHTHNVFILARSTCPSWMRTELKTTPQRAVLKLLRPRKQTHSHGLNRGWHPGQKIPLGFQCKALGYLLLMTRWIKGTVLALFLRAQLRETQKQALKSGLERENHHEDLPGLSSFLCMAAKRIAQDMRDILKRNSAINHQQQKKKNPYN